MSITIHDVARRSGYSITTVSHALNGHSDVNEETREKIIQIAKELNYQPNRVARNLVTKKFNAIGVFILGRQTFQNPFVFEVLSGFMDEASAQDYDMLLFGVQSLQTGMNPGAMCRGRGAGGAFVMGSKVGDPIFQEMAENGFPTCFFDIPVEGKRSVFVSSDNQSGSDQAIEYLAGLGHGRIGFINGHMEAWVSIERLKGYKNSMAKHSLTLKPSYIFQGDFSKESGKNGVRALLKHNPEITAVFTASDLMAAGAMEELRNMGFKVPEDISVIGFDDQEFASHTNPALTTIRQEKYRMGAVAAKEIIKMIEDETYVAQSHILDTRLIIRESVCAVKHNSG